MPDLRLRLSTSLLLVAGPLDCALRAQGLEDTSCLEALNVMDDELVCETYRRFRMAGAQCALANTQGAYPSALAREGYAELFEPLNRAGIVLPRRAGFEHVIAVLAAKAPLPELLQQAECLLAEEPDALMVAGDTDTESADILLEQLRRLTPLPLLAPAGTQADVCCFYDLSPADTLRALEAYGESAASDGRPVLVAPRVPDLPYQAIHRQAQQAQAHLANELTAFALAARARGATLVGTAGGSLPLYTGALYAAMGLPAVAPHPAVEPHAVVGPHAAAEPHAAAGPHSAMGLHDTVSCPPAVPMVSERR